MLKGSLVALVTPFKEGRVDEVRLRELVNWHIQNGTSGIVPCGTTGESATLTEEEHNNVIDIVVDEAKKRIPVIAGTGSNNTKEAIKFTKHAEQIGADASLLICPYYNKPTQNGLYEHFKAIANSVEIPIVLYNIESRTGVNMTPELVQKLSLIDNIQYIKEASGDLSQMSEIIKLCGDNLTLLSGDDALLLPVLAIGGAGVISVVANIAPRDVANMINYFQQGNIAQAREYHYKLFKLIKAMFIETNPIPVKKAMEIMGLCSGELRLPMLEMNPANVEKLKQAMREYGIAF
ncbi:4-hydroxy-tetrahydrodipicolinate synthase [bacterium]